MTQSDDYKAKWEAAQARIEELENELAHANQNFENLFENAGDSIFVVDLASYKILDANGHASRRLGYSHNELIGMSMDDIEVFDDTSNANALAWESTFSATKVYEYYYRHKNGEQIPVEVSSRIVSVGDQEFILNFVRDISVRKRMEAERENLIADLQSFDHTVAHDLKNPLSTLHSYLHFLSDIWDELSKDEIQEHLQALVNSSRRAIEIVNALMLFASARKDNSVETSVLDMPTIIADVQNELALLISERNAKLEVPTQWPAAVGYAPWIKAVWSNYVSNAVKYGGDPPVIELGSTPAANGMIRFWVYDNGAGIEPEKVSELFQEFNRLGEVRIEGHGIGLSIVKRIVEKLGGTVGVESTPGAGSTFYFTLPAGSH